ncbi:MAG: 50S ribosomal protein L13 [bacterium]
MNVLITNDSRTYSPKPLEVTPEWFIIDATDMVLGRLSTQIAMKLMGKDKPQYSPHAMVGDCVIVINAANIAVTGNKLLDKKYYHHSGYPGGIKEISLEKQLEKNPAWVIENAVKGMLPKNKLAKKILARLHVYAGSEHPHEAQQAKEMKVK